MKLQKHRKIPVVVEAGQWFKHGDLDVVGFYTGIAKGQFHKCEYCEKSWKEHGWIITHSGGHLICPGDWIIKGVEGEFYPCKPSIFSKTYEEIK